METEKTLDRTKLPELPKKNFTSLVTLRSLSEMERNRTETNVDSNQMKLLYKGYKVNPDDYIQVWKDLEALGAGILIHGRNGNPTRFKWHYSLKDVASEAIKPEQGKDLVPLSKEQPVASPKRRYKKRSKIGRPPGSKNRTKAPSETSYEGIVVSVRDIQGSVTTISLNEAIQVAEQVAKIKELVKVA